MHSGRERAMAREKEEENMLLLFRERNNMEL